MRIILDSDITAGVPILWRDGFSQSIIKTGGSVVRKVLPMVVSLFPFFILLCFVNIRAQENSLRQQEREAPRPLRHEAEDFRWIHHRVSIVSTFYNENINIFFENKRMFFVLIYFCRIFIFDLCINFQGTEKSVRKLCGRTLLLHEPNTKSKNDTKVIQNLYNNLIQD